LSAFLHPLSPSHTLCCERSFPIAIHYCLARRLVILRPPLVPATLRPLAWNCFRHFVYSFFDPHSFEWFHSPSLDKPCRAFSWDCPSCHFPVDAAFFRFPIIPRIQRCSLYPNHRSQSLHSAVQTTSDECVSFETTLNVLPAYLPPPGSARFPLHMMTR